MYKKMTFISICTLILVSFFTAGCKKYLEAKSDDKKAVPDNLPALQAILDEGHYMNGASPSMGEGSADDYFMTPEAYEKVSSFTKKAYIWDLSGKSENSFGSDWARLYLIVYNANLSLDQLRNIPRTTQNEAAWNNVKGAALFFRGRSYLQLSWLFSKAYNKETAKQDLGIVLRSGADFNVPSKRASIEDSYQKILDDLKSSLPFLPNTVEYVTRPTKAAAYGYLSRTYLSMRKYDSALLYANKCLQVSDELMDFNDPNEVHITKDYPFQDFNKEMIHDNYDLFFSVSSILEPRGLVDTTLYGSYKPNDLRKMAYFTVEGKSGYFRGSYRGGDGYFTGPATDEMYLIRAECEARNNQVEASMKDLNALLVTRWKSGTYMSFLATSKDEALELILQERRKELIFRGLRWMDIKRLNLEGANITIKRVLNGEVYTLPPNDNRFALPLPTDIINLTGMPQNPQ